MNKTGDFYAEFVKNKMMETVQDFIGGNCWKFLNYEAGHSAHTIAVINNKFRHFIVLN